MLYLHVYLPYHERGVRLGTRRVGASTRAMTGCNKLSSSDDTATKVGAAAQQRAKSKSQGKPTGQKALTKSRKASSCSSSSASGVKKGSYQKV